MKVLLSLLAILAPQLCFAQEEQVACLRKFDEQFSGLGAEMANLAGVMNYKSLVDRATQCVQGGKCIKAEIFISISELMVDEEVIRLQREKLSKLKKYFAAHKSQFASNNYCAIMATFPSVLDEVRALNRAQLARFQLLMQRDLEPLLRAEQ
jgi:hypothetical protein